MTKPRKCIVGNANCMCQYCEDQCNNGLNCWECEREGSRQHDVYLCTGFTGNLDAYIQSSVRGKMPDTERKDGDMNNEKQQ